MPSDDEKGRIVLVEHRGKGAPDDGGSYLPLMTLRSPSNTTQICSASSGKPAEMYTDEIAIADDCFEVRPGAASAPLPPGYQPRRPESKTLHRAVRLHLATFLEDVWSDAGHGLPRFVERELRQYLTCGVLAHGFARVRCTTCGDDMLVGFSCKGRGICPSCTGRRAADTAAHLTDDVFPHVPLRQWVLSFPIPLRLLLLRRPGLVGQALRLLVNALSSWRRRQGRAEGIRGSAGTVTFVQRFGSALNANLHFHVVAPDGIFDDVGTFHRLPAPSDEDVEKLLVRLIPKLRRKLTPNDDSDNSDDDTLSALSAASVRPPPRASSSSRPQKRLCANVDGFSLHAAVKVHSCHGRKLRLLPRGGRAAPENDHRGREHLCRYGARGAVVQKRLSELPDGRFRYEMKRPTADGRTHLTMTGVELLRKLAPLVPPPRQNLTRYHGVFAPNSHPTDQREGVRPREALAKGKLLPKWAKLRAKVTGTHKPSLPEPTPTTTSPAPMPLPGVAKRSPPSRIPWPTC